MIALDHLHPEEEEVGKVQSDFRRKSLDHDHCLRKSLAEMSIILSLFPQHSVQEAYRTPDQQIDQQNLWFVRQKPISETLPCSEPCKQEKAEVK